MTFDTIIFYFFAALAVVSAIVMITRRSAVHSAVFLITTLLATAGIFLQLEAEFLFVVQIILYVGGIMVLFLFVIMLVNLDVALRQIQFSRQAWVGAILAIALGAQVLMAFRLGSGAFNLPAASTRGGSTPIATRPSPTPRSPGRDGPRWTGPALLSAA